MKRVTVLLIASLLVLPFSLSAQQATGSITALNGSVSMAVTQFRSVGYVVTGTWTATLQAQISMDAGTTWQAVDSYNTNTEIVALSVTGNGTYIISETAGASNVRITATAFTSGAVTVVIRGSQTGVFQNTKFDAVEGTTVPAHAAMVGGTDGTNVQALSVDTTGRPAVVGAAADGAAAAGNPVRIAGKDGAGNTQDILTDTGGAIQVDVESMPAGGSSTQVQGTAADGAAPVGNPVQIGGSDGVNMQTVLTDTAGRPNIVGAAADGAALAGNPVLAAGTDGTNAQTISVDTTGRPNVNLQRIADTNTVTGGVAGLLAVAGNVASDGVDSANPIKIGGLARTSEITAVANADRVDAVFDVVGKQITSPYSASDQVVSGVASTTTTADTSTIAAQGVGVRIFVNTLSVANSSVTATIVEWKDGVTVIWRTIAPANGGSNISFLSPLRLTANAALNCAALTAVTTLYCSAGGYTGR